MRNVYVGGVGMTSFGKSIDSTVPGLAGHAVESALGDAALSADRVGMVFFGNAMGGTMTGQEMIRAKAGLGLTDFATLATPMVSVENACASSSSAVHLAWMAVASGQVDVALAVGAEKMTSEDKTRAFRGLASAVDLERVDELEAALYGGSPENAAGADRSLFMDIYADMARRYTERSGATAEDFARVAVKAHEHGALNPHAQYRNRITVEEVLGSRMISDPLTLMMCSPIGDGAAAVVLCSEEVVGQIVDPVRLRASVLVSGVRGPSVEVPASARAAQRAYEIAGIGPEDVDVVELHDAAAPAELIISEELGLCGPGEASKLLADGETTLGGRIPINTSGGLISKGHPVGATGCAQIVELSNQLRGRAGDRQVEGARVGLAENGGGYLGNDPAAVVVTILSRD
ncbi:thiolase family protein [Nocardioides sp. CN2-186]|uniref:thiolase family protein n=1 Tax=Nocardioides tweenelious TaxID=3156607 RepID=UPI0032B33855